jgi:Uma2 family endonuclease
MGLPATPSPEGQRLTLAEYFRFDLESEVKHEFRDGEVVAMAGGTGEHGLIIANVIGEVRGRLKGKPCRVYSGDLRIAVNPGTRYVYPDASVICAAVEYDPADAVRQTATNPRLIVEVLSPSTEAYDRGEKFRRYLRIPSFEEYVLVSQAVPVVETYTRQPDGTWAFRVFEGLDAVARMRSVEIDLPLAEVFAGVEFPPPMDEQTNAGPPPAAN